MLVSDARERFDANMLNLNRMSAGYRRSLFRTIGPKGLDCPLTILSTQYLLSIEAFTGRAWDMFKSGKPLGSSELAALLDHTIMELPTEKSLYRQNDKRSIRRVETLSPYGRAIKAVRKGNIDQLTVARMLIDQFQLV